MYKWVDTREDGHDPSGLLSPGRPPLLGARAFDGAALRIPQLGGEEATGKKHFIDTHFKTTLWPGKGDKYRRAKFADCLRGWQRGHQSTVATWPGGFDGGPKLTRYDRSRGEEDQPVITPGSQVRNPSVELGEFSSSKLKLVSVSRAAPSPAAPFREADGILPLVPTTEAPLRFQLPLRASETTAFNRLLGGNDSFTMVAADFFDLRRIEQYPSQFD